MSGKIRTFSIAVLLAACLGCEGIELAEPEEPAPAGEVTSRAQELGERPASDDEGGASGERVPAVGHAGDDGARGAVERVAGERVRDTTAGTTVDTPPAEAEADEARRPVTAAEGVARSPEASPEEPARDEEGADVAELEPDTAVAEAEAEAEAEADETDETDETAAAEEAEEPLAGEAERVAPVVRVDRMPQVGDVTVQPATVREVTVQPITVGGR